VNDALFQEIGERHAEFVSRSLRGLGEAKAQRLLPVILSVLDDYASRLTEFAGGDVVEACKSARRGFRIRGAELGYLGSDRPRTIVEAWRRRRVGEINDLLSTAPRDGAEAYLKSLGVDDPPQLARYGQLWVLPGSHPLFEDNSLDRASDDTGDGRPLFNVVVDDDRDDRTATYAILQVIVGDDLLFDFVAWDVAEPTKFWTLIGGNGSWPHLGSPILGDPKQNPHEPLVVHRTPVAWLANNCVGVVPLNDKAGRDLACADQLVAQDLDHAREIARLICSFADPRNILVAAA
jgi:hypothetical protein